MHRSSHGELMLFGLLRENELQRISKVRDVQLTTYS